MRKQLLGVFLPLLAMVLLASAETQSTGADTTKHAALQKVEVVRGSDGIRVQITARGQVTPKLTALDRPARVVIDLPNTVTVAAQNHINVADQEVKGVRIGSDGQNPPTTRVVVDLAQACKYELVQGNENQIVLKLATPSSTAKEVAKPATTKPIAPVEAAKNQAPTLKPAALTVPAAVAKPAEDASSPVNFAFIEPSYKPKDDAAAAEPSVRASTAASKFVSRPEGDLMPARSAAQAPSSAPQPAVNMAAEQKSQMAQ